MYGFRQLFMKNLHYFAENLYWSGLFIEDTDEGIANTTLSAGGLSYQQRKVLEKKNFKVQLSKKNSLAATCHNHIPHSSTMAIE